MVCQTGGSGLEPCRVRQSQVELPGPTLRRFREVQLDRLACTPIVRIENSLQLHRGLTRLRAVNFRNMYGLAALEVSFLGNPEGLVAVPVTAAVGNSAAEELVVRAEAHNIE